MIYPENFESKIGFDTIRNQCRELCTMRRSAELLDEQGFTTSARTIATRQALAAEMGSILTMDCGVLKDEFFDIDTLVEKIRVEGTFLDCEEVMRLGITLSAAETLVEIIRGAEHFKALNRLSSRVVSLSHLTREIARIIDERGNMRDNASAELAAVRREIRQSEGMVSKRLQSVLQGAKSAGIVDADAMISIRDGRAVIPVAAANKRKLQGFIHDESATGKTFYVEPVEVVELNNKLKELEYAERREVVKILTAFTDLARADVEAVAHSGEFVAQIDMIRAKARWAAENDAVQPIISSGELWLVKARHPLLAQTLKRNGRELVPLDARLDNDNRILVISGPNAGGKSVCLKTFGILQYMFQCGFPVTVGQSSEFPVFDKLFIDIGDQQSIENDLSTYSSHLINMKAMLAGADSRSLVLIDEFGTGTEPVIGAAIAEAVLEKLVDSRCFGVITTHYSNIKYYASSTDGIINGAMMFDVQNIRPLFRLETGKPGSSFAIEIARKIGLPEAIIASARDKAGSDHIDIEKQLREIARDKRYWEQKREKIRLTDRKVEELEQNYHEQLAAIREERRAILHEAKTKAKELIAEANRQIEGTIRGIREAQAEREQTRVLRQSFNDFKDSVESADAVDNSEAIERQMARIERRRQRREERKAEKQTAKEQPQAEIKKLPVTVDAKVRLLGHDGVGVVQSLRGKKAQVAFGQMLTTVEVERLEVISSAEYHRATRPQTPRTVFSSDISQRRLNFKTSIDVRGERVVDALERIRDFVDDALMVGVGTVTILHGKGTGALQQEIRRYLRTVPAVQSAVDDHPDRGGSGITIVTFSL
ncbi:MAG: Smr/MutS family protein [Alistipes sp.]|nr:Smr/MutS family protein [Alistipes sp.]MBQ9961763.1 Smr/MutS family protein [Alistipes sp.]